MQGPETSQKAQGRRDGRRDNPLWREELVPESSTHLSLEILSQPSVVLREISCRVAWASPSVEADGHQANRRPKSRLAVPSHSQHLMLSAWPSRSFPGEIPRSLAACLCGKKSLFTVSDCTWHRCATIASTNMTCLALKGGNTCSDLDIPSNSCWVKWPW